MTKLELKDARQVWMMAVMALYLTLFIAIIKDITILKEGVIMTKEQPTKLVQMKMTRAQIEGWAASRYYRNTAKYVVPCAVLLFAGIFVFTYLNNFTSGVFMMALLGLVIWWFFKAWATGRRYWKEVKDKPEPLKM